MTEESSFESRLNQLTKRIDDQARFTRTVVVVSTAAMLGVMAYALTEIVTYIPRLVIAEYMASLDSIQSQWKLTEQLRWSKPATTSAPSTPTKK
ncbi:MAG: hypothetical protein HY711_01485 [Candidatus Melainabacteria bacterium]|nr:hypothetical protein [Candidatus Melainabacteria bacterium]